MKSEKKITVEFTQEQLETAIEAIVRAAEQDAEDIELMANIPGPAQEIVKGLAQSRKTLLRMSAWLQHVLEEALVRAAPKEAHAAVRDSLRGQEGRMPRGMREVGRIRARAQPRI